MNLNIRKVILISLFGFAACQVHAKPNEVIEVNAEACKKQEIKIKGTPFEVDIFCEDALGVYIGIIHRGIMGLPVSNGWTIEDRYWQVKDWSMDVKSLMQINDGKNLLISTSGIYGDAGIYLLDLSQKTWKKVFAPKEKKSENIYILKSFNSKRQRLVFFDQSSKKHKDIKVNLKK